VQPKLGLGWPEHLVVMSSNPEGGFWPRECWWGRGGWGVAKHTGVWGVQGHAGKAAVQEIRGRGPSVPWQPVLSPREW